MTSGKPTGEWLLSFVRENAFAITVAIFAAYSWFSSSNAALAGKVDRLEQEVRDHRATLKARARFVNDATNQLNYLCATTATCRQLYAPIAVPE